MVVYYPISNFKSIKHKEEIKFIASPLKCEDNKKPINDNLLNVVPFYGPNGGENIQNLQAVHIRCNRNKSNK